MRARPSDRTARARKSDRGAGKSAGPIPLAQAAGTGRASRRAGTMAPRRGRQGRRSRDPAQGTAKSASDRAGTGSRDGDWDFDAPRPRNGFGRLILTSPSMLLNGGTTMSSPTTDASTNACSPTWHPLQSTDRQTSALAAMCVFAPRLVGPTTTAFGPTMTPAPSTAGPTIRAVG